MTSAQAGMVTTDRADCAEALRRFRNHGISSEARQRQAEGQWRYEMVLLGFNYRLSDIACALGLSQLKKLEANLLRRREIAARYTKGLQGTSFRLPVEPAGYRHVFHLYVIEHPRRDDLEKFLLEAGVDVKLHYPIAIHKQEGYPWGKPADLRPNVPSCERNAAECVSLPMFPELTDGEVDYTIEQCLEWDRLQRR